METKELFRAAIDNGIIRQVPLFNKSKNKQTVTNWLAVISPDPENKPYHLEREFISKTNKDGYYVMSQKLKVGTPVEFGSTVRMSRDSQPLKQKWYGVVADVSPHSISFLPMDNFKEAFDYVQVERETEELTVQETGLRRLAEIKREIERLIIEKTNLSHRIETLSKERDTLVNETLTSSEEAGASPLDDLFATFNK